ncbi:hypothetical protein AMS68_006714 [Peltaster fructicola]|uniref:Pop1 N-terminal domain-containing protein n=1 Tax=Peltaster fructicola TaxID=286661 RepID=A0A6H0Y2G4_9PEZI|nr:hypothetical protein AMS68_006714 [Peltaster fructicola]
MAQTPKANSAQHPQPTGGKKRKSGPDNVAKDAPAQKKVKSNKFVNFKDARTIATQTTIKAFEHGELDVDKFVKSREYEIRALEQGLVNSKKALSKRAFQLVPKDLRRRTASHNAKRVPKKLRARAKREMKEDNTPTVTAKRRRLSSHQRLRAETAKKLRVLGSNRRCEKEPGKQPPVIKTRTAKVKHAKLAEPPVPKARFRRRQRDKSWLPTHLFHAKRARMTPPKEPVWRFALPMTPTAKSYRATHRTASDRGTIAFDMSYMSTICLRGRYTSLLGALQMLDSDASMSQLRYSRRWAWLRGEIAITTDLYHRDAPNALIAPVTVIWCPSKELSESTSSVDLDALKGCLLLRVHPSAFFELWEELLRVSKTVKPAINVEDLRYELGSIELIGPAATEALLAVLKPCSDDDKIVLSQIDGLSNTALLPAGTVFDMEMQDPRLCQKSRKSGHALQPLIIQSASDAHRSIAARSGALFDRHKRVLATSSLPSQKAINRRRSEAPVDKDPPSKEKDPRIPVLLYTATSSRSAKPLNQWTLLLPWKCVLPVWYSLIYTPLSTGLQPRFGGLTELREVLLEHSLPWFPADYPATRAGQQWEMQESQRRKKDWSSHPKSKRVNWEGLELGNGQKGEVGEGWTSDWTKLSRTSVEHVDNTLTVKDSEGVDSPALRHVSVSVSQSRRQVSDSCSRLPLIQVRIEHISRGVPQQCARIYRLPASPTARKLWLALHPRYQDKHYGASKRMHKTAANATKHEQQQQLARSLLEKPKAGQPDWPACPTEDDLIGFVTAGNFDLSAGYGTAIGSIVLSAELAARKAASTSPGDLSRLCIVRNSGQTIGRLARWHLV